MRERIKRFIFGLLRKDPDAIVVSFATGDPQLTASMLEEVRALVPDRRHFAVSEERGSTLAIYLRLRRRFRRYRIGLAAGPLRGRPRFETAAACGLSARPRKNPRL